MFQTNLNDGIGSVTVKENTYYIMKAIEIAAMLNSLKTMNPNLYISRILSIHGKVLSKSSIGQNGLGDTDFSVPAGAYVVEMKCR